LERDLSKVTLRSAGSPLDFNITHSVDDCGNCAMAHRISRDLIHLLGTL